VPVAIILEERAPIADTDLEPWRSCPVAIAVDMVAGARQIDPAIRPLCPPGQQPRLVGRAVTARCDAPDFGAVLYAIDLIEPGDVLVIAAAGDPDTAMIGEILGGQVRRRGGRGIVCDGAVRDVATLAAWPDFAVFARSTTPRGPRSAAHGSVNGPVTIGGSTVDPGDLLIGDDDGLVVLPPAALAAGVSDALAKLAQEERWQARLAVGESVAAIFDLPPPTSSR
jgi:regulator of RNase E activity RraA